MAEETTIARPYAQAIFSIAQEQDDLQGWTEMLALSALVAADPDMAALIDNPRVSTEQTIELFIEVCGERLNDTGKSMVRVLAENGRLPLLPEIARLYEAERAEAERTVKAQVVSATALNETQQAEIARALGQRLGREVSLECTVDETLLGGAVIRAGDLIIDGSVVGKLDKLGQELLH